MTTLCRPPVRSSLCPQRQATGRGWGPAAGALVALAAVAAGRALASENDAPPAAPVDQAASTAAPDFVSQVQPLLEQHCIACHGSGQQKGGLRLDTREAVLAGGDSGAVVEPGQSGASRLIALVVGGEEDLVMPAKGRRLRDDETALLQRWIDGGLPWPEGLVLSAGRKAPLRPRRVELPPATAASGPHPIDRLLSVYDAAQGLEPAGTCDDATFARRVYLDVIGLLPPAEAIRALVADGDPDKRTRLVDRLLADRHGYAQHWLSYWNDLLRNDYRGTGYIDGGRKQISAWLYRALADNLPYDQFVAQLIDPAPESEGFLKGIVWRGVVNASQVPEIQAAQNLSQVFLGVNLKCASCHDSFVNHWKLVDAYALAGIVAEGPLEIHRCDRPTGEFAPPRFLYPELGEIDAALPRRQRLAQLARLMTHPENGRLARTIVNRLWARLLGRGLVEPVDALDNEPFSQDLLDWLAVDLVDAGYDLKHTLRQILTSRAYQRPSVAAAEETEEPAVFRGPLVRRMTAEQFVDAAARLTGQQLAVPATELPVQTVEETQPSAAPEARRAGPHRLLFASGIVHDGQVEIDVALEGAETLWLVVTDGEKGTTFDWAVWAEPRWVMSDGASTSAAERPWRMATSGYGSARWGKNVKDALPRIAGRETADAIGTHAYSVIALDVPPGAVRFRAAAGPDSAAVEQSQSGHEMEFRVLADLEVRAVMTAADPLQLAMGRPNREQVVTSRATAATTLEALELTNGATLAAALEAGATRWLARAAELDSAALVDAIFRTALGREATPEERASCLELLGPAPTSAGLEDLLWAIAMLPEFQLIY